MIYQLIADLVVAIHFAFIVFVLLGGLLLYRWRWVIWLHLPSVIWGVMIVFVGWICPLTPLENMLREAAGAEASQETFIEHYLMPIIYPSGLHRESFIAMAAVVIMINLIVYALVFIRRKK